MLFRLLSGSAAPAQSGAGEARPKQPVGGASLPENQRLRLRFPTLAARGIPRALRSRSGRSAANEA